MSALALARPGAGEAGQTRPAPSLFDDLGGEPTLDEVLVGVWEGLAVHRSQACPACGGEMEPVYGAHARPLGGRCTSCATKLA